MPTEQLSIGVNTPILANVVYATPSVNAILSSDNPLQTGPAEAGPFTAFVGGFVNRVWIKSAVNTNAKVTKVKPGTYLDSVRKSNPSYYWRLGETSGLVAQDMVGGANGTISGGVTLGASSALSDGNRAMTFDGTTGKIVTPNLSMVPPWTWELWVRTTSNADRGVISNFQASFPGKDQALIQIAAPGGGLNLFMWFTDGTSAGSAATPPIHDGGWHHVVAVFAATRADLYVDGVAQVAVPSGVHFTTPTAMPFIMGTYVPGSTFFLGTLDEVAIYPRALTASEILAHYNAKGKA